MGLNTWLEARDGRDVIGGFFIACVGIAATVIGARYPLGSFQRMGAGFMPVSLGVLLTLAGLAIATGSRRVSRQEDDGEEPLAPSLRVLVGIAMSMGLFIVAARYVGFAVASPLLVFVAAIVDRGNSWRMALIMTIFVCAFSLALFVYLLGVPIPLFV